MSILMLTERIRAPSMDFGCGDGPAASMARLIPHDTRKETADGCLPWPPFYVRVCRSFHWPVSASLKLAC